MVANILSEHKDEIKRNVEQQSKLISNRLQQSHKVMSLSKDFELACKKKDGMEKEDLRRCYMKNQINTYN